MVLSRYDNAIRLRNFMVQKFIFVILIIIGLNHIDAKPKFNRRVGERAVFHAQYLLQNFPPNSHFIVGLGLSTALINSAIRVMLPDPDIEESYLMEVPVTDLDSIVIFQARTKRKAKGKELGIKHLLPKRTLLGNREIVLVRAIDQFDTMEIMLTVFFQYLKKNYLDPKVNLYFIQKGESILPDEVSRSIFVRERDILNRIVLMNHDYYAKWVTDIDRREVNNSTSPFKFMRFKPESADSFIGHPDHDFEINPDAHLLTDEMRKFYTKLRIQAGQAGESGCNSLLAQANQH